MSGILSHSYRTYYKVMDVDVVWETTKIDHDTWEGSLNSNLAWVSLLSEIPEVAMHSVNVNKWNQWEKLLLIWLVLYNPLYKLCGSVLEREAWLIGVRSPQTLWKSTRSRRLRQGQVFYANGRERKKKKKNKLSRPSEREDLNFKSPN